MEYHPLTAALDYLIKGQHPDGSWTDFWMPVGTSDAWVTAFVGLAVLEASRSRFPSAEMRQNLLLRARAAAEWLHENERGGWGYNGSVPPDADSTAHAVSLLSRLDFSVPDSAFKQLERHHIPGEGYRTYQFHHPAHRWTRTSPDITAAVLRALFDSGRLSREELADLWQPYLNRHRTKQGIWSGYWWFHSAYPTALALEVWNLGGKPPPEFKEKIPINTRSNPFNSAWMLYSTLILQKKDTSFMLFNRLLRLQNHDGGWPSDPILKVPPHHGGDGVLSPLYLGRDAKRFFTTAGVVRALVLALEKYPALLESREWKRRRPGLSRSLPISDCGLKKLIGRTAGAVGFEVDSMKQIQTLFSCLTRGSLAPGNPWPSSQLSALAAGVPLEFSCRVMSREITSLRYTVEVGNPFLPPYSRACSALRDIQHAVEFLGYEASWEKVRDGIVVLVSQKIEVPNDTRFWVWSGVDHKKDAPAGLKIYLNLFGDRDRNARKRLESALRAASVPKSRNLRLGLDRLDYFGFPQEAGFGLGPNGKIAFKVYYELRGWRPELIEELLGLLDLPGDLSLLRPEIPGILKESLAKKNRAGIALRVDPENGSVSELTVSAAFLPAMLPALKIQNRLEAWIRNQGWNVEPFSRLANILLDSGEAFPDKRFSLFTRTVSQDSAWTTIYIRPYCGAIGWNGKPVRQTMDTFIF